MKRHDSRLTYGRTCVYNINYHIVWGTKYRNKVLNGKIEEDLKSNSQLKEIINEIKAKL